ncbi:hypothetical protein J6590_037627 [Homalodisca vitripennis]|nr:hypothetical protein J6590_037627 [Homalodisca vitripennis]
MEILLMYRNRKLLVLTRKSPDCPWRCCLVVTLTVNDNTNDKQYCLELGNSVTTVTTDHVGTTTKDTLYQVLVCLESTDCHKPKVPESKNVVERSGAKVTSEPPSAEVQPLPAALTSPPPAASPSSPAVAPIASKPQPAPSTPPQVPPTPPNSPETTATSQEPQKTTTSQEPQQTPLTPPPTPPSVLAPTPQDTTSPVPPTSSRTHEKPQELPVNEASSRGDVVELTDQIVDKLDDSLDHLESSFVNYVEKNKKIIHNLADMLAFEKHKQRALEDSYKGLKQENDILRTKMDYLKLVNFKQLELFRNELDKGISENKAVYKNKIRQLEMQVQQNNDELQSYKQTEKKYLEILESSSLEIANLTDEVKNRQYRESELLNNYVKILNFLNVLKEKLTNSSGRKEMFQEPSDTICDSEKEPKLNEVLKQALNRGMNSLNVRDLSIIHDAIQDINEDLCHVGCGKNQLTSQLSISHITTLYGDQDDECQSGTGAYKGYQAFDAPKHLADKTVQLLTVESTDIDFYKKLVREDNTHIRNNLPLVVNISAFLSHNRALYTTDSISSQRPKVRFHYKLICSNLPIFIPKQQDKTVK